MVVEQSIDDQPKHLALFAGGGGGILAGELLGWRTMCAVEIDAYACGILIQRQNDGCLAPFPVWTDIRTFDGKPWRGRVDIVSGGFPCQDISAAGKRAGIDGPKSSLWAEMARVIGEVRPTVAYVENSPDLRTRGLDRVLGDLSTLGYDARWGVVGAANVGAPHQRDRMWIVAHTNRNALRQLSGRRCYGPHGTAQAPELALDGQAQQVADACGNRGVQGQSQSSSCRWRSHAIEPGGPLSDAEISEPERRRNWARWWEGFTGNAGSDPAPNAGSQPGAPTWWDAEPDVGRVVDGMAARVDRLRLIGNGQVPLCAVAAWQLLTQNI